MGFALGTLVFGLLCWRYQWVSRRALVGAALVGVLVLGAFSTLIAARLSEDYSNAGRARLPLMKLAFRSLLPFVRMLARNISDVPS